MDYDELLSFYTHRGFRVIACATKRMSDISLTKVDRMKRPEVESNLEFIGFIVFENKLKASTAGVIKELHNAGIRKIMCTGDNVLTAISVAKECSLIDRTAHCFVPHFVEGKSLVRFKGFLLTIEDGIDDPKAHIKWQSADNHRFELDEDTLLVTLSGSESESQS